MRAKSETWAVAGLFLKLGLTAFGGPAAHIALMRREVVDKRRWLSEEAFLDLLGATNLIPGPNSTEMAIHIGYLRAGWPGLILSGIAFIVPAMAMAMGLACIYVGSGSVPQVGWLLYGVKPVVVALILHALWNLGRKAIRTAPAKLGFIAVLILYFLRVHEIALLLGGGILAACIGAIRGRRGSGKDGGDNGAGTNAQALKAGMGGAMAAGVTATIPFTITLMFWKFLRIGSVLYGSGYVLLPFLRSEFVERTGWLSEAQLLDAVSVGQLTPGPFFTTASFIGYLLGGVPGGIAATAGIFLPAFVLVALSNPWLPRLRRSAWLGRMLDGVNAASLGLMAGAAWQIGKASVTDTVSAGIGALALYLLFRGSLGSTWLIAGGAAIGLAWKSFLPG